MCAIGLFQIRLAIFFNFLRSSGTNRRRTPFCPRSCLKSVWNLSKIWVFLKSAKIKILFVSAWLLTKSCFWTLPSMGEVTKTERVFICPIFVWKIYPQNSYLANLPCGGKKWKCWKVFIFTQRSIWIFTDILPSKIINSYRGNGKKIKWLAFFQVWQKFCEVFFTKPLHNGIFAAFCHLTDLCRQLPRHAP